MGFSTTILGVFTLFYDHGINFNIEQHHICVQCVIFNFFNYHVIIPTDNVTTTPMCDAWS